MARTFNAGIWGGIGDAVARDDILRRERNQKALGGLLDAAKFIEKTNANRNLRKDWQDYFANRKSAQDAAAEDAAAQDMAAAFGVEDPGTRSMFSRVLDPLGLFGYDVQAPDEMESSIWDPSMIANGYEPALAPEDYEFIRNFNPKTATPEEILMAQRIVGTDDDGKWGPNSRAAYKNFMEGRV